jgi:hypothetical protein
MQVVNRGLDVDVYEPEVSSRLVLSSLLVAGGAGGVLGLVELVYGKLLATDLSPRRRETHTTDGILGSSGTGRDVSVAVLSNVLVGLLGGGGGGLVDLVTNV